MRHFVLLAFAALFKFCVASAFIQNHVKVAVPPNCVYSFPETMGLIQEKTINLVQLMVSPSAYRNVAVHFANPNIPMGYYSQNSSNVKVDGSAESKCLSSTCCPETVFSVDDLFEILTHVEKAGHGIDVSSEVVVYRNGGDDSATLTLQFKFMNSGRLEKTLYLKFLWKVSPEDCQVYVNRLDVIDCPDFHP